MTWTTDVPTVDGLYWLRSAALGGGPWMVEFYRLGDKPCIKFGAGRKILSSDEWPDDMDWAGPIVPPED